mmetsp:Transcript_37000/g.81045  ORF Transcript_37000/g.81045 Transcript_37000/m.81045 type:complete len:566 (-) Transcript_37000:29-1726(-)
MPSSSSSRTDMAALSATTTSSSATGSAETRPAPPFGSWRVLSLVVVVAACIHLAYLVGYHRNSNPGDGGSNRSGGLLLDLLDSHHYGDDGTRDNGSNSNSNNNPLYPYPNYPRNYVPPPGTGPYKNGRTYPKVFVCITGQLPRLELTNKINNLFQPWHQRNGVEFDVALVLTDTNHASVHRIEERDQEYYTVREVYDHLSALEGVTVLNDNVDVQSQNPILNPHYTQQRAQDTTMTPPQVLERVQNHVRQFESLAQCHHHLTNRGTAKPSDYDVVHRIREDSGYLREPDFTHVHDVVSSHPMTILSSDCQIHGGINDRGSFVSADAAYDYFVDPIVDMYVKPLPKDVRNTEQFLMVSYAHTCRLVQTDSFQIFRLWEKVDGDDDGNVNGDGNDDKDGEGDGPIGTKHITEMEFSQSDLKCLERKGQGLSTVQRHKFCHDYSDGYDYCIFYDKAGVSYYPGKAGLLRDDDDGDGFGVSARPREDWVPDIIEDGSTSTSSGDGVTFNVLNIGLDASAPGQVDTVLDLKTNDELIAKKKAERKKKRKDWNKKHKHDDDDGNGDGKRMI